MVHLRSLTPVSNGFFSQGHPVLQAELARVRAGVAMEAIDVTRYRLDPPPLERKNDVGAWRRALDNAHSQLEHQYNRCSQCLTRPALTSCGYKTQSQQLAATYAV